jgi:LAO/AO transport system kinase
LEGREIFDLIFPHSGKASLFGFTGAPGAGKSTLVDRVALKLSSQGKKIAIIAVDPSSPFSGGAILGDRIRMSESSDTERIFIRSMASRSALGGLAPKTAEVACLLDAAGYDFILIETVGVGQAEVEIMRLADIVTLVMVPGMGDGVQALKAGIIEIADVFVINKSDYDGADRLKKELLMAISLASDKKRQNIPIINAIASQNKGIEEVVEVLSRRFDELKSTGELIQKKQNVLQQSFKRELSSVLLQEILTKAAKSGKIEELMKMLYSRKYSPRKVVEEVLASLK